MRRKSAWSRTMYGVRKSSRLVFIFSVLVERNSRPTTGMSPSSGVFSTDLTVRSWIRPPMTTVCWSRATMVVLAERLAVVGPSCGSRSAISSVCSSICRRMKSLSLICGLIFSFSSTLVRWMGAMSPP